MTRLSAPALRLLEETRGFVPSPIEATVLVVDDNPVDRRLAGAIVEKRLAWRATYARDGSEVLPLLEREPPSVVLTDLVMPRMSGLELVEAVRAQYPQIPVVLMTAYGSEEIALEALRKGAASYVPKKNLPTDLMETLRRVLAAANRESRQRRVLHCLTDMESRFALETDLGLVPALVAHLQEQLGCMGVCDEVETTRAAIALEEAILNGLYHGNLECGTELHLQLGNNWREIAWQRCTQRPYRERRLSVQARLTRDEAAYVIHDEGPGFDPSLLPDPANPANLTGRGRGLVLIRMFMDEVRFNAAGNEITLIKRRRPGLETEECAS